MDEEHEKLLKCHFCDFETDIYNNNTYKMIGHMFLSHRPKMRRSFSTMTEIKRRCPVVGCSFNQSSQIAKGFSKHEFSQMFSALMNNLLSHILVIHWHELETVRCTSCDKVLGDEIFLEHLEEHFQFATSGNYRKSSTTNTNPSKIKTANYLTLLASHPESGNVSTPLQNTNNEKFQNVKTKESCASSVNYTTSLKSTSCEVQQMSLVHFMKDRDLQSKSTNSSLASRKRHLSVEESLKFPNREVELPVQKRLKTCKPILWEEGKIGDTPEINETPFCFPSTTHTTTMNGDKNKSDELPILQRSNTRKPILWEEKADKISVTVVNSLRCPIGARTIKINSAKDNKDDLWERKICIKKRNLGETSCDKDQDQTLRQEPVNQSMEEQKRRRDSNETESYRALDQIACQEQVNENFDENREQRTSFLKVVRKKSTSVSEYYQERGNYCISLLEAVDCSIPNCSRKHFLELKDAPEQLNKFFLQFHGEMQTEKMFSFWEFHTKRSIPVGNAILSSIAEMVSQWLKVEIGHFRRLVEFVKSSPEIYSMTKEQGRLVMQQLLAGFVSAVKREHPEGSNKEVEMFFSFAWERIYRDSMRSGLVLDQSVLENICSLAERMSWYCELCKLLFYSSLGPTNWVPLRRVIPLLSHLSSSSDNIFCCRCRREDENHTLESCLYLAETLGRLTFLEWDSLRREIENFTDKIQVLVDIVSRKEEYTENIRRFIDRVEYWGMELSLPLLEDKNDLMKGWLAGLAATVKSGNWRDVAIQIGNNDNTEMDDMVEIAEELYGVMRELPTDVAVTGYQALYGELQSLNSSQFHWQLYCQIGLSLLLEMVPEKYVEACQVVQAMEWTNVDLRTLKPFTVFSMVDLDEEFRPISVPLMLIKVYRNAGCVDRARNLLLQWNNLSSYPRPLSASDQNTLRQELIQLNQPITAPVDLFPCFPQQRTRRTS